MIEMHDLVVEYGHLRVLCINNVKLKKGEIVTIIGQNGAGKSTLQKCLTGLTEYKGAILVDGKSLKELPSRLRAQKIVYLPQAQSSPVMQVATLVSHGRFPHLGYSHTLREEDRRIVVEAMKATHVDLLKDRFLDELSLGERQRAFLAMVIATESDYLLLDEPGTYLDLMSQHELMQILLSLKRQGKGIVLINHDLPVSFSMSDQLILLDHGEVLQSGTPEDFLAHQDHLRKVFHVGMKKIEDPHLLYQYVIIQ